MKRDLHHIGHLVAPKKPLLCRLGLHRWTYQSQLSRSCICGCKQKANEDDARDFAEFNWENVT